MMVSTNSGVGVTTGRMKSIQRVLWIVLLLNLAVALAKYFYGLMSDSASMQADGIHSIFDSAGNVIGLIGIALASRPADDNHPYGHAKFETYASAFIGVLLIFAAYNVATSALSEMKSGSFDVVVTPFSFIIMVGTLVVNLCVTLYERKMAKKLNSEILAADASHTLSDALVSISVIVGLVFVYFGYPMADALMALVVSAAILSTAYEIFKRASETLSDHVRIPATEIEECVKGIDGVKHCHKIRTRGPEGEVYVDMHVLVDPLMTVVDSHEVSHRVERAIYDRFPQVAETLVHIEPDDEHVD